MKKFEAPKRSEVNEKNQAIFDHLTKCLGFIPNLYAYFAKNVTALADYLALQNRKTTLSKREREIINLIVSEINGCRYCQSTHNLLGGLNGFTEDQIIQIRKVDITFDNKYRALANLTAAITNHKGNVSEEIKEAFFIAGYTEDNLIDVMMNIGDKIISNYMHNFTGLEIDFPLAPSLKKYEFKTVDK